jgi:dUTP pyrophosphatase
MNFEEELSKTRELIQSIKALNLHSNSNLPNMEVYIQPSVEVSVYTKNGVIPKYQTEGSSGMDLHADIPEEISINPGEIKLIPTGTFVNIPRGYEFQLRARSGTSFKKGLTLINGIGTIDSDYHDEIGIPIINLSGNVQTISPKERIAQLVLIKTERVGWKIVSAQAELISNNSRNGGFGSTGTI